MPVTPMKVAASGYRGGPLLRLVLFALAAFLFRFSACREADAQVNMTLGQLMPNLVRNTAQVVTASPAGLQVAEAGSVAIGRGSTILGSVAINELRSIPLATIAGRAVTSSGPLIVAMLAVDLIKYGITQCTTSPNGWCKQTVSNPASGDVGFDGYSYWVDPAAPRDSPGAAAAAAGYTVQGMAGGTCNGGACVYVSVMNPGAPNQGVFTIQVWRAGCAMNYVSSGGGCSPAPNAPTTFQPVTYPDLSPKLAQVLSGNPDRAKDYWGFEPWTERAAWLQDPSTQALPAQIVSPADGKVAGPTTTTQTAAGTTTSQTSCTVSPNSDATTLASKPVAVACQTVTTNPDGTTSTTTTTTTPTTTTDPNSASSVAANPPPASSPIPCGLGIAGSPKCQIDETGTKQQSDVDSAQQTQTSAMTQAESGLESAANGQLAQVDAQHQSSSAHFFTILNMIPTFGTETCTPPTIVDPQNHITVSPAICDWYYAAKDIMSLIVAFGLMLSAVFMVKDTAQSTAAS